MCPTTFGSSFYFKMKKLILVSAAIILVSCAQNKNTLIISKENAISLNSKEIFEVFFQYPDKIIPFNDHILISDLNATKSFINITNDGNISSFGSRGDGPNEISNPPMLLNQTQSNSFFYFDFFKKTLFEGKINDSIFRNVKKFNLPEALYSKQSMHMLNNEVVLATGGEKYKLSRYNVLNNELKNIDFQNHDKAILYKQNNFQLKTLITASNFQNKVLISYENLPLIELYDTNLNLEKDLVINHKLSTIISKNNSAIQENRGLYYSIIDLVSNDNYLYFLFVDDYGDNIGEESKPIILVLDWELNFKHSYLLNQFINKFTVIDSELFGINPFSQTNSLVKFEMLN